MLMCTEIIFCVPGVMQITTLKSVWLQKGCCSFLMFRISAERILHVLLKLCISVAQESWMSFSNGSQLLNSVSTQSRYNALFHLSYLIPSFCFSGCIFW